MPEATLADPLVSVAARPTISQAVGTKRIRRHSGAPLEGTASAPEAIALAAQLRYVEALTACKTISVGFFFAVLLSTVQVNARAAAQAIVVVMSAPGNASPLHGVTAQLRELEVEVMSAAGRTAKLSEAVTDAGVASKQAGALGTFWIGTYGERATLFLYDATRARVLMRAVPTSESPTAREEQMAIIVRSTVIALLEHAEPEMDVIELPSEPVRDTARQVETKPQSAPSRRRGLQATGPRRHGASAAISASVVSALLTERWSFGGALSARVYLPAAYLGAGFALHAPVDTKLGTVGFQLTRRPIELFAGYRWSGRVVSVALELAFQADALLRMTKTSDVISTTASEQTTWVFSLSPRARVERELVSGWLIFAAAGLETTLSRVEYVVVQSAAEEVMALPRWRPRFELGIQLSLP